jgi:hypothetical protein
MNQDNYLSSYYNAHRIPFHNNNEAQLKDADMYDRGAHNKKSC